MRIVIAAAALCLGGTAYAHNGHDHGVIELPKHPEIRTAQDARREAEEGCLKLAHRQGPLSVRVTYSSGDVTVNCPSRAAVAVEARIRF